MTKRFAITSLCILMYACDIDQCGDDIDLGRLDLDQTTQGFVPYSGDETLIFEDHNGVKHQLRSREGRQLSDTRLVVNTLCRGNIEKLNFDDQEEFYQTQRMQIAYFDQSGNQIFYIDLLTLFEEAEQPGAIAIYDLLSVYPSVGSFTSGDLNIITKVRQNELSPSFEEVVLQGSDYVGDTVLFGKEYKDVYRSAPLEEEITFYNRTEGVIAFVFGEDEYWVLSK